MTSLLDTETTQPRFQHQALLFDMNRDEVLELHGKLVNWLIGLPPLFVKDESLGSAGGDPRLFKGGKAGRK